MLKLTGLPHFLAVCTTRSLTAAAEVMGVSQPALTQAIAKLERQLDVTLFDRSTRPLNITQYGHLLLEYARALEQNSEELAAKLEAMKAGSGGTLRIGCGPDWVHDILPYAISRIQKKSPDIRVKMTVALSDELRALLDAGDLDLFFASLSDVYLGAAYENRVLLREEMVVVARKDHPVHDKGAVTLDQLAELPWAMTGDETFGRQLLRRVFGRGGVPMPRPTVETNSVPAMINVLRYSQAIGFLSLSHTMTYPEIAPVKTESILAHREGGVTWRRDAPLMPAAEALVELAAEKIDSLQSDSLTAGAER